jgi:NAD(P)-dependent dehydrogenase (short-subunit alcohol dehydrogenase family)
LEGKTAIVTGASKGIGKVCALALADGGADVVLASRNLEGLKRTAAEVEEKGSKALPMVVDILKESDIEHMVTQTVDHFGKVDILVNNAGTGKISLMENLKTEDWDRVIDTNLKGTFLCCRAVIPEMKKRRYGKIINMCSLGGIRGSRNMSVYNASKGGIMRLSESLALEVVDHGILVNCICPGMFLTDMNRPFFEKGKGRQEMLGYPMRRPGRIDEITGAVIYLASDASSYVTASALIIDGAQRWKGAV